MVDLLSQLFTSVRLAGTVYFQHDFHAPWGMCMDDTEVAQFHLVVSGKCYLHSDALGKNIWLEPSDKILFLKGTAHELSDAPQSTCATRESILEAYKQGILYFKKAYSRMLNKHV